MLPDRLSVGDVLACGLAWQLSKGSALLTSSGKLVVRVKGLLINDPNVTAFNGTTDGVTRVFASLVCGANGDRKVVASSTSARISNSGDATIIDDISLPEQCIAPAILVREVEFAQGWLATTGF